MEPLIDVNCSPIECTSLSPSAPIWQDILAQAMTGELLAAMNYTSLSEICDDPAEVADALEHSECERGHAAAFAAEGRKIGVDVTNNVDAKHWKRLRDAFLRCITERDFIGCLIVQEIMLESFAVASYSRVGKVGPGSLGETFARIAAEEGEHVDHAMSILRAERARDAQREVCHASCVKPSLFGVSLSAAELRGASLQQYLKTLDMLGIPGEVTLRWVTQLPV